MNTIIKIISKRTNKIIIIFAAAVVFMSIFVTAKNLTSRQEPDSEELFAENNQIPVAGGVILELDSAAKDYTGESPENKSGDTPGIKIPGYVNITIPANTENVCLTLLNPADNPCYFTFELFLQDTGESLYQSKMVEPAKCIDEITLSKPLKPGTYNLTIKILTYEINSLAGMNNANIETVLIVV